MIKYINKVPTYKEYNNLKIELGFKSSDKEWAIKGLNNSILCVCAYDNDKLVGMGRIVGDDAMVYVISNIMVKKEYHNKGIGFKVVSLLMNYLDENCGENALVMLMARKGTEEFYKKFGFICRPSQDGGYGMCKYY
ncbi:GNAT family N-acetyltransferase [Clostridium sp. DL1XJH146]